MGLSLVTAPTAMPVTRNEAKLHCRIDGNDEDTLIDGLIAAATDFVEKYTGSAIMTQTWRLTLDKFEDTILLPIGPVQAVNSITYYDVNGAQQNLSATVYQVDLTNDPQRIVRSPEAEWPSVDDRVNAISVTFTSGSAVAPTSIKQSLLLLIGDWYRNRENTIVGAGSTATPQMPFAVHALLSNYRRYGF